MAVRSREEIERAWKTKPRRVAELRKFINMRVSQIAPDGRPVSLSELVRRSPELGRVKFDRIQQAAEQLRAWRIGARVEATPEGLVLYWNPKIAPKGPPLGAEAKAPAAKGHRALGALERCMRDETAACIAAGCSRDEIEKVIRGRLRAVQTG